MIPLPPQTMHLPFEDGPFRMAMGLFTVPDSAWFELDARYPDDMAERARLLNDLRDDVFGVLPMAEAACREALDAIANNLTQHHPDWFARDAADLHNRLTDERWHIADPVLHPLEIAARLVQEDLCLIQVTPDGPIFSAGALCFPSRWRLHEKLGLPLADVHGPVPIYPDRLARPVDRFMEKLRVGHIASRLNWSVLDDPTLFQPGGKWRKDVNTDITADNAGQTLFLRVERQTLRRLPITDAILFGIRVHNYPLHSVARDAPTARQLAGAVRALPESIVHYKSFLPFRPALLAWLDARG